MPINKEKTVRTSVIVPSEAYQQIKDLAAANDVSAAWIIRHALMEFLNASNTDKLIPRQPKKNLEMEE